MLGELSCGDPGHHRWLTTDRPSHGAAAWTPDQTIHAEVSDFALWKVALQTITRSDKLGIVQILVRDLKGNLLCFTKNSSETQRPGWAANKSLGPGQVWCVGLTDISLRCIASQHSPSLHPSSSDFCLSACQNFSASLQQKCPTNDWYSRHH